LEHRGIPIVSLKARGDALALAPPPYLALDPIPLTVELFSQILVLE